MDYVAFIKSLLPFTTAAILLVVGAYVTSKFTNRNSRQAMKISYYKSEIEKFIRSFSHSFNSLVETKKQQQNFFIEIDQFLDSELTKNHLDLEVIASKGKNLIEQLIKINSTNLINDGLLSVNNMLNGNLAKCVKQYCLDIDVYCSECIKELNKFLIALKTQNIDSTKLKIVINFSSFQIHELFFFVARGGVIQYALSSCLIGVNKSNGSNKECKRIFKKSSDALDIIYDSLYMFYYLSKNKIVPCGIKEKVLEKKDLPVNLFGTSILTVCFDMKNFDKINLCQYEKKALEREDKLMLSRSFFVNSNYSKKLNFFTDVLLPEYNSVKNC